jgi:hypothetical protein
MVDTKLGPRELAELRWHWNCYQFSHPVPDTWLARRSDNGKVLQAETASKLHDLVVADYTRDPIPLLRGAAGSVSASPLGSEGLCRARRAAARPAPP